MLVTVETARHLMVHFGSETRTKREDVLEDDINIWYVR